MRVTVTSVTALLLAAGSWALAIQQPGSRSFARRLALEAEGATSANVSIGDLNADGHLDLVLVKGRHWPLDDIVLPGDGRGGFAPAYTLGSRPDRSYSGWLVDMDGDGDPDVGVSNTNPAPKEGQLNERGGRFQHG